MCPCCNEERKRTGRGSGISGSCSIRTGSDSCENENAAEVKTTKEAKISVAVFLVAMVGIVLLGAMSALVPTLSDGSKLPLTTVIEILCWLQQP